MLVFEELKEFRKCSRKVTQKYVCSVEVIEADQIVLGVAEADDDLGVPVSVFLHHVVREVSLDHTESPGGRSKLCTITFLERWIAKF
jgi:hypothetical protein